jgi:hypothetical protein
MTKLNKNRSIINCLSAGLDLDRSYVIKFIENLIKNNDEYIKYKDIECNYSITDLGPLERKYWAKGGSVMRKMTVGSFIKKNTKGKFLIRLDKEMIYIKDGETIVGDPSTRDKINQALTIQ